MNRDVVERTRFGERLTIQMEIEPETLDICVPNLILQPLVEEHQVRLVALDRTDGLDAIAGLSDDLDALELLELIAELLADQLLIVHDHHTQRVTHSLPRRWALSIGH